MNQRRSENSKVLENSKKLILMEDYSTKELHKLLAHILGAYEQRVNQEKEANSKLAKVEEENKRTNALLLAEELEREKASEEIAKRMQAEFEAEEIRKREERRKRLEEENMANCKICFDNIEAIDLLPLDRCGHTFHPDCIRKYLSLEIEARRLPLICPSCKVELTALDIKDLLTVEFQEKWYQYSLTKAVDSNPDEFSYCPTPDCQYIFLWKEGKDASNFTCPVCSKHYCLNCRCVFHEGKSCKQYQVENNFTVTHSFINRVTIKNAWSL